MNGFKKTERIKVSRVKKKKRNKFVQQKNI